MLKVGVVGYLLQFSETKNNCSACNAKSKGGRGKAQHSFVDSHNSSVRESVWWVWPQPLARCIES